MTVRSTRREFAAALAGAAFARSARAQPRPPNILLVVANEVRGDALGSMGHPVVKTPNLDALAREGALLRNFFAVSATAAPARVSLLSGRYPGAHGALEADRQAKPGTPFLPRLLAAAGYRTGLVGDVGFAGGEELFETTRLVAAELPDYLRGKYPGDGGDPLKLANEPSGQRQLPWRVGASVYPAPDSSVGWTTARALEFIREDASRPWFLTVGYDQPRHPYILPYPWPTRFPREQIAVNRLPEVRPEPRCSPDSDDRYVTAGMEGALVEVRQHYYGAVAFLDEQTGMLVDALRAGGALDDTIVVFTADRGNMLGDLGRMFDGVPYDGVTRLPGVIRYPAAIPAARRVANVLDAASLAPTLLDLAGIAVQERFDAPSAKPLLTGDSTEWDDAAFGEDGFFWVRTARYKLVQPGDHPSWTSEFYDLASDPLESVNLIGADGAAEARRELETRLQAWRAGSRRAG